MENYQINYLDNLEAESIFILREVFATAKKPVLLYSIGKDSSVLLHLAAKAFYPVAIPFSLMHVDTGFKFPEMIDFRDFYCQKIGVKLIIERNEEKINEGVNPSGHGIDACCRYLKTEALLRAIKKHGFDLVIGGARRDEEKSRAKERIFSLRNELGGWDPKNQRLELWHCYNTNVKKGETLRVFPLSNWTELDVWNYIKRESIEVVPLYFSHKRLVVRRKGILVPVMTNSRQEEVIDAEEIRCRFRSLGCFPCTGAIESSATTVDEIIKELWQTKKSERENRIIDLDFDSAMEDKKRQGYF